MKSFKKLYIGIFALILFGCEEEKPNTNCIDTSKIREGVCTLDYNPVCGCNGENYSNACAAELAGITTWASGKCK